MFLLQHVLSNSLYVSCLSSIKTQNQTLQKKTQFKRKKTRFHKTNKLTHKQTNKDVNHRLIV